MKLEDFKSQYSLIAVDLAEGEEAEALPEKYRPFKLWIAIIVWRGPELQEDRTPFIAINARTGLPLSGNQLLQWEEVIMETARELHDNLNDLESS